ncbi:hypothetical protein GCM10010402_24410 [Actinomadura luteofluorescens]
MFPSVKSYTNFRTGSSFSLRFHPVAVPGPPPRGAPHRVTPGGGGSAALFAGTVPANPGLARRPVRRGEFSQLRLRIVVYSNRETRDTPPSTALPGDPVPREAARTQDMPIARERE